MTFRFRPLLTAFVAAGLAGLVALGVWQLHRLEWKQALIARIEARVHAEPIAFDDALSRIAAGEDMEYQPVQISGRFQPDLQERIFGIYDGAAGAYVFTPLVSDDHVIYVNRGFAPERVFKEGAVSEPSGRVEATGLLRYPESPSPPASWFRPKGQTASGLWFVRDPLRLGAQAGIAPSSYYIDSFATVGPEWPKGGTTRLDFRNNHFQYALTWFGLAAALLGIYVVFSFERR
ncbi:MAG: SURF1 family protein [Parvularculaceae bacterium]